MKHETDRSVRHRAPKRFPRSQLIESTLPSLIHPPSNRLEFPTSTLASLSDRNREAVEDIQWRKVQVAMKHDCLPQAVETMFQMRVLVVGANYGLRKAVMVLHMRLTADTVHSPSHLDAYSIDAVQVMEHVWSVLAISGTKSIMYIMFR